MILGWDNASAFGGKAVCVVMADRRRRKSGSGSVTMFPRIMVCVVMAGHIEKGVWRTGTGLRASNLYILLQVCLVPH